MKTCTKCGELKPLEMFSRYSRNKTTGRQPVCKACHREYQTRNADRISKTHKARYAEDKEGRKRYVQAWCEANRERSREIKRRWREKNAEKMDQIRRQWAAENPDYIAANCRYYQASKRNATPSWANRRAMQRFYAEARKLTKETGVEHHVDHIVPIISDLVCGLHVEANLQVLRFDENVKKGNRAWPDMPQP